MHDLPLEYDRRGRKRPLPAESTDALPGSEEKIRVMRQRLLRGEQLFHPKDARVALDGTRPTIPLSQPPSQRPPVQHRARKPGAGVALKAGRYEVQVARTVNGKVRRLYGGRFTSRTEAEQVALELLQRLEGEQAA